MQNERQTSSTQRPSPKSGVTSVGRLVLRLTASESLRTHGVYWTVAFALALFVAVLFAAAAPRQGPEESRVRAPAFPSPESLAFSPDGATLAVSDRGAGSVVLIAVEHRKIRHTVPLRGQPAGIAWLDDRRLAVCENGAGAVAELDSVRGAVLRRIPAARYVEGIAVAPGGRTAVVCDRGRHQVQVLDLVAGKVTAEIPAVNQPHSVVLTPDGATAVVANLLPDGDARRRDCAAKVTLVDLKTLKKICDVPLPPGAVNVRGIAVSPDGQWAYAVHNVARTDRAATQLERGWLMANAVSVIDLRARSLLGSRVLDALQEGAANPWGAVPAPDGRHLWITLGGTHQAACIDLDNLHTWLGAPRTNAVCATASGPGNTKVALDLDCDWDMGDACAAYLPRILRRVDLPGNGPRGIAVGRDGAVAVSQFFTGDVAFLDKTGKETGTLKIGPAMPDTPARRGERAFSDARLCQERWLSCASCHPGGRADGLNWDLLNDGIGNPKNTKSLVWSDRTPPMMATGVRESMEAAVRKGFENIQFASVPTQVVEDVCAYLRTLEPEQSPYLENGTLGAIASRGQDLFATAGCVRCHPAPHWTDLKSYDVGTGRGFDPCPVFDTPTCVEPWRTAPFLHDGSAATLKAMLTECNREDRHGRTTSLSAADLEALVAFLNSL